MLELSSLLLKMVSLIVLRSLLQMNSQSILKLTSLVTRLVS